MHRMGCGVDTQPMSSSTEGMMVSKWQRGPHPQSFLGTACHYKHGSIQLWGTRSTEKIKQNLAMARKP